MKDDKISDAPSIKEFPDELDKESSTITRKRKACFVLKTCIFVVCCAGFISQTMDFLNNFFKYPTITNIEVQRPDTFMLPTMTVCNTYPLQRSKYCTKYPKDCSTPYDIEKFCQKRPHLCNEFRNGTDFEVPFGAPSYKVLKEKETFKELLPFEFLLTYELHSDPFPLVEPGDLSFASCYAFNAHFNSSLEPQVKNLKESGNTRFLYYFNIVASEDEYMDFDVEPFVKLYIHPPFIETKSHFRALMLKPNKYYKIYLRVDKEILLPYPYDTDCIDYIEEWRNNNKTGPRSLEMCQDLCQEVMDMACYGCIKDLTLQGTLGERCFWIDSKKFNKECDREEKLKLRAKYWECKKLCKKECTKLKYHVTVEERIGEAFIDESAEDFNIYVEIVVDDPEVMVISHVAQYMDVELFSYVGGFLGCWLGISIWACAEIFEKLFACIVSRVRSRRVRNKDIRKNETSLSSNADFKV